MTLNIATGNRPWMFCVLPGLNLHPNHTPCQTSCHSVFLPTLQVLLWVLAAHPPWVLAAQPPWVLAAHRLWVLAAHPPWVLAAHPPWVLVLCTFLPVLCRLRLWIMGTRLAVRSMGWTATPAAGTASFRSSAWTRGTGGKLFEPW